MTLFIVMGRFAMAAMTTAPESVLLSLSAAKPDGTRHPLYSPFTNDTNVALPSYVMPYSPNSISPGDYGPRVHPDAVEHGPGIGRDGDAGLRGQRQPGAADHVAEGRRHRRPHEPREQPLRAGGRGQPQDRRRAGGGRRRVPVQERERRGLGGRGGLAHGSGWSISEWSGSFRILI